MSEQANAPGRVVRVTTQAPSGGVPRYELFGVHIGNDEGALEAFEQAHAVLDETVEVVGSLSEGSLRGLGIGVGAVKPL